MRRLLTYLRPYRRTGGVWRSPPSSANSVLRAGAAVPDQARDRPLHSGARPVRARRRRRALPRRRIVLSFLLEYVQTWMMQLTGQRIMFDLRMQIFGHLQRLDLRFYDRNPVGRLMTRVTTRRGRAERAVHRRRRLGVRRRVHAARHHGDAGLDGLAAGARRLLGAAADRRWSRSGSAATCASRTARCARWIARINAFLQERITGHGHGAAVPAGGARLRGLRRDRSRAPRRQRRVDLLLRGVLSGDRAGQRAARRR